jgi:hypothetical protein
MTAIRHRISMKLPPVVMPQKMNWLKLIPMMKLILR